MRLSSQRSRWSWSMRRYQRLSWASSKSDALLLAWICVCLCFAASCKKNHASLRDRIVAANTSQYCRMPDECFNPHILVWEKGYAVTVLLDGKAKSAQVSNKSLAQYLEALPMQAWPRGPIIEISQSDVVFDADAIRNNFTSARQTCLSMGLDVHVRLSG